MTGRQAAIQIIRRLHQAGFEALLAGGCVRDMLLGKKPKDYDVATNAIPEEICKIFRRTIKVGAKFGVVIVLVDSQQIEVATFRADAGYSDGRRPDKVIFTSAREDAIRRDFTINGMFYDPLKRQVIDYVNGQADLKAKIIRTIGNPVERFSEDYLRMLRAVRFAAQLGFKIQDDTLNAIKCYAPCITKISGERIAVELELLFAASHRNSGIRLLIETGLAGQIFPALATVTVADFAVRIFEFLPEKITFALALAAFLAGCSTSEAMENLKILKLSRSRLKHIKFLLEKRGFLLKDLSLAQLKLIISEPYFEDLYTLQRAIQKTQHKSISKLAAIKSRAKSLIGKELRPKPLLNGNEVIRLGVPQGPQVGQVLKELYIEQLSETVYTKRQAIQWVKDWLQRHR